MSKKINIDKFQNILESYSRYILYPLHTNSYYFINSILPNPEERKGELVEKNNNIRDLEKELTSLESEIKKGNEPLKLGIVGGFSTGKSSFINALIGEELLGVKLQPATAQVTYLKYGEKLTYKKVLKSGEEIIISPEVYQNASNHADNNVAKAGDSDLSHFLITYPAPFLSTINIIDTPGFSSESKADDEVTKGWIDELDALVWLFDANKVGDKEEADLLNQYRDKKIIGIINKIDSKPPSVREKIKAEVEKTYAFDSVFFYSAKKTLDAITGEVERDVQLEALIEILLENTASKDDLQIDISAKEITVQKNGDTLYNEKKIRVKENKFKEFEDAFQNRLTDLKQEVQSILLENVGEHYTELNDFKYEVIDDLSREVNALHKQFIIEDKKLRKTFEDTDNNLKEFLGNEFDSWQKDFFNKLFDKIFQIRVDSGIFSSSTMIETRTDDHDKAYYDDLKQRTENRFNSFLNTILNNYGNTLNNLQLGDPKEISTLFGDSYNMLSTIIEGLVESTIDGTKAVINCFEDYETSNANDAKEWWTYNLDLAIPDEQLRDYVAVIVSDDFFDICQKRSNDYQHYISELKEIQELINNL
ncbi:dynamin family protein [Flammeovirga yaeyamensis]|uniref:Dynamin family protein n=1 Tax=Flammeovirga yaeyamensis TaxID=367791 RepID=A0AAX1N701_9BACT|nr:dynamin family protein [Flammeovirga yaeyamensis]MBB3701202.1 small GTP-binding protein [Flammeovirga yaeyamensis]NMF38472.1 hypothetical protein [Flammeovirga yaeyamensis]QWG01668.1 dynamin family protein [Flammeovirga yaeyamensis]